MRDKIVINGVTWDGAMVAHYLNIVTNPDPNRWYNFRRDGDTVICTVKTETE